MVSAHPNLVRKRVVGQTAKGRDIIALQVTKDPTGTDIAGKPAVLYNAMQHAREWLAGETCKRTLSYFVDNYGKTTSAGLEVTPLVDNNELWFVCVNNPDGYEYTFTSGNRLWRKNLRDNNNNGTIEPGDGVDPNRNFSANWGRDDEAPRRTPRRRPTAARAPRRSPRPRQWRRCSPRSTRSSRRTTTRRRSCCCTRRASSRTRRRPTTRSSPRSRAIRSGPASRASCPS